MLERDDDAPFYTVPSGKSETGANSGILTVSIEIMTKIKNCRDVWNPPPFYSKTRRYCLPLFRRVTMCMWFLDTNEGMEKNGIKWPTNIDQSLASLALVLLGWKEKIELSLNCLWHQEWTLRREKGWKIFTFVHMHACMCRANWYYPCLLPKTSETIYNMSNTVNLQYLKIACSVFLSK